MKILFGADLVPTQNTAPDYVKGDIKKLFGKVCDIVKDYDRFIVNLECALTESENIEHEKLIKEFAEAKYLVDEYKKAY